MKMIETANYNKVKKFLQHDKFFPICVSGPAGTGKTSAIMDIAKNMGKEFYRINIDYNTDEADLIGTYELVDGNTIFKYGPVIDAMKNGALLILDEVDLANPLNIMCLQSILEGNGYYIKKTKERVEPEPGFNVIATANTKGIGDFQGGFVGTQILNEAFLDRFKCFVEYKYPSVEEEVNICKEHYDGFKKDNEEINMDLVNIVLSWAGSVRHAYLEGNEDYTISTRKVLTLLELYYIMDKDITSALEYSLNRYDESVKSALNDSFMAVYNKNENNIDPDSGESSDDLMTILNRLQPLFSPPA